MKKVIKKHQRALIITGVCILVVAASASLAYAFSSRDPISLAVKKIYPAAIVGASTISVYDWDENLAIAHRTDPNAAQVLAKSTLLENTRKQILARKLGLPISISGMEAELAFDQSEFQNDYQTLLDEYFSGQEDLFAKYVAAPQYYDSLLRVAYNSDTRANAAAYAKAQELLMRINTGEKFEDVAAASDDTITAPLGGDLGVVSQNQVLPELAAAVQTAPVGKVDPQIVVSRYGYHILYPVEAAEKNGQKVWHVKQILIQTSGYEAWLNPQLAAISVWQIK
jgi:hypothetical protein